MNKFYIIEFIFAVSVLLFVDNARATLKKNRVIKCPKMRWMNADWTPATPVGQNGTVKCMWSYHFPDDTFTKSIRCNQEGASKGKWDFEYLENNNLACEQEGHASSLVIPCHCRIQRPDKSIYPVASVIYGLWTLWAYNGAKYKDENVYNIMREYPEFHYVPVAAQTTAKPAWSIITRVPKGPAVDCKIVRQVCPYDCERLSKLILKDANFKLGHVDVNRKSSPGTVFAEFTC